MIVRIEMFKKKKINHHFFGDLVYKADEYVGEIIFPISNEKVDLYFSCPDESFDESYYNAYKNTVENFDFIIVQSVNAINVERLDIIEQELGNQKIEEKNLSLEGVFFKEALIINLFFGLIDNDENETSIQVTTSYDLSKNTIEFLGVSD